MTYIKKIVFQGFKSFNQKTVLETPNSLVCITGPNGSGKSNVFDGIGFVLGELSSKGLRTQNLSNLIYNGGSKGRRAKFAKVELFFDNTKRELSIDKDEVTISRQVNHKGQGTYRINGQMVTRSRIMNLMREIGLHPNSFSIIKQGQVQRFVDMSEKERLGIIEDVSGITSFDEKKHKTELELNKVEKKFVEIRIVLGEKEQRLKEIETEKRNALRFEELKKRMNILKASFLQKNIDTLNEKVEDNQKQISTLQKRTNETKKETLEHTQSITKQKNEITQIDEKIRQSGGNSKLELGKTLNTLKEKRNENRSKTYSIQREVVKIKEKTEELNKKITLTKQDLTVNNREHKKVGDELSEKEIELSLQEKQQTNQERIQDKLFELKLKQGQVTQELLKLENEKSSAGKLTRLSKEKNNLQKNLNDLKKDIKKSQPELDEYLEKDSYLARELNHSEQKTILVEKEKTKLEGIKISFERSLGYSVKVLLENKKDLRGILGVVNQLYSVKPEYELAINTLLGRKKALIITNDTDSIKECIDFLKRNKIGKASFLALNTLRKTDIHQQQTGMGVIGRAIDLISFKPEYKNLFIHLLRNSLIINDFSVAKRIGIGKVTMSSLQGELFLTDNTISGGFIKKSASNHVSNPAQRLEELYEESEKLDDDTKLFENERMEVGEKILYLRELIAKKEGEINFFERRISEINMELNKVNDTENVVKRIELLQEESQKIKKEIIENEKELIHLKETQKGNALFENVRELKIKKGEVENKINSMLKPKVQDLVLEVQTNEYETKTLNLELKNIKTSLKSLEEDIKRKQKEYDSIDKQIDKLFTRKKRLNEFIKREENKLADKNLKIEKVNSQIIKIQIMLAKEEQELDDELIKKQDYSGIETIRLINFEDRLEEVKDLEYKVKNFGAINQKALEIYDDIKEEYDQIHQKYRLLETEKEDILLLIDEIEKKKSKAFMKTFVNVSKKFSEFFKIVSSGEGNLELTIPENPLEGGLDVRVKTREEKSFTHLRSLSGGEKTITAIAFIMALQDYSPTPFYIMDEIDAALDKENSQKLGELLTQQSKKAQFIVVSHNDSVLSQAEYLYGVTMNKLGESKLVGIKL